MKKIHFLVGVLLIGLMSGGCVSSTQEFNYPALRNRCRGAFKLEAGDSIRLNVWGEERMTQQNLLVRHDGKITIPLVGDIQAAGLSINQLKEAITDKLEEMVTKPKVDVYLQAARSYQIFVMGEVRNPGTFTPQTQVNVLQALSLAGGFTAFAKKDHIIVLWKSGKGELRIPFNYEEMIKGVNTEQNLPLCRGDTILVP